MNNSNFFDKRSIILILLLCSLGYLLYISYVENFSKQIPITGIRDIMEVQKTRKHKYNETLIMNSPKIIYIENFITPEQANHLMAISDQIKRPSTIDTKENPYTLVNNVRSSESAHLGKARDRLVKEIEDSACDFVGLDTRYLEPMQVVVYEKGQKFNEHYDFFGPDSQDIAVRGNRNKTILVYLNDIPPEAGGATIFSKIGLKIQPKAYSAVYFENMNGSQLDYNTLHAGLELTTDKIKKYAINIWFREKPTW
jgi:prolyl 4-hydroxylase